MVSVNLNYIAVLNIKSLDYCCIISLISKSEAINWGKMRQNADLTDKTGTLYIKKYVYIYTYIYIYILKVYIKMEKKIIKFDDIKITKQKFHQHKIPTSKQKEMMIK